MYHTAGVERKLCGSPHFFICGFPQVVPLASEMIGGICLDGDWPTGGRIINKSLIKALLGLTLGQVFEFFSEDGRGSIWSPHV